MEGREGFAKVIYGFWDGKVKAEGVDFEGKCGIIKSECSFTQKERR